MTDIKPALTAEEWASVLRDDPSGYTAPGGPLKGIYIETADGFLPTGDLFNAFTPHQLIALVNNALPNDDPRKITREDVKLLRLSDERIRAEWDHPNSPETEELRNLAAKLAALLPPE